MPIMGTRLGPSGRVKKENKPDMSVSNNMRSNSRWIIFFLLTFFSGLGNVLAENGSDEIFGGQILSMTEEKPPLVPSNDPRFQDNNDGTI